MNKTESLLLVRASTHTVSENTYNIAPLRC